MAWSIGSRNKLSSRERAQVFAAPLSLDAIYREHFDFVYRMASRLGGPQIDPEDVAQEVFVVVARKLGTYDRSCLITTWLYGITLNVVRAQRRRGYLRRLYDAHAVRDEVPIQSVDRAEVREAHKIVYQILDRLSPKKREVFILAEFEELTCEEIAKMVGTQAETVWSRLHYARREFAERLQAHKRKSL